MYQPGIVLNESKEVQKQTQHLFQFSENSTTAQIRNVTPFKSRVREQYLLMVNKRKPVQKETKKSITFTGENFF